MPKYQPGTMAEVAQWYRLVDFAMCHRVCLRLQLASEKPCPMYHTIFWHEGSFFTVGGFVDFLNDHIVDSFGDWILA